LQLPNLVSQPLPPRQSLGKGGENMRKPSCSSDGRGAISARHARCSGLAPEAPWSARRLSRKREGLLLPRSNGDNGADAGPRCFRTKASIRSPSVARIPNCFDERLQL
jgi:hypothetical protein